MAEKNQLSFVKAIAKEAKARVTKKNHEKYVEMYERKLMELSRAEQAVKNLKREIEDLEIQIADEM